MRGAMMLLMMRMMMKVMEREGKLGELEVRAETLQQGSEQFQVMVMMMMMMVMVA